MHARSRHHLATLLPLLFVASLGLTACGQEELYSGLTEREANEMLAVVQSAGIGASKASKDGAAWTLRADSGQFPEAVALLQARGYPRERYETLGQVFKKSGFVSSPLEERARLVYGLSQELSQTVSSIDGVVSARVHLAMPEADPLSDEQKPSSASVFIKHDPQVDLTGRVASIKALVTNSVEGLPYERVTVVLIPARPLVLPQRTPRLSQASAPGALALAAIGGLAGFEAWRRRRRGRARLPVKAEP